VIIESLGSQERTNFLNGCLVESDTEFEKHAGRIKRRALVASIFLQILIVAALVLFPLLSKGKSIVVYNFTPAPPYHRGTVTEHREPSSRPGRAKPNPCRFCAPLLIPTTIPMVDHSDAAHSSDPGETAIPDTPHGPSLPGLLEFASHGDPPPFQPIEKNRPRAVQVSAGVQAAKLVRRIEPVYPYLAKTTRREGRVELRARISTDGRVESLEVIAGDPLLIQSALDAVQEWHYQPTLLNSEPVEVDTYITGIYTLRIP
jgi:TonB family protein